MQSSEHRDVPEKWAETRGSIRFYLTVTTLIIFALFSTLFGIVVAQAGNLIALRYFLLFALMLVLIAAFPAVARCRRVGLPAAVRTVERDGISGTEIRYSTWQFTILVALMACFAIFCSMGAVEIYIHQDEGFPGGSVLFGAFGVIFASFVAAVAFGRIHRGGVTLSTQGIVQRGWSFESRLDWSGVAGVTPAFNGYPAILVIGYRNIVWDRRYTTRFWRIDRLPPVPMIQFDCRQFNVDPYVLFNYVRAYIDNPELRAELGTDAALTRARQSPVA
ncbi:hypothetical protein ACWDTP_13700 [Mycobacterium sp. NPDC003449]